MKEKKSWNFKYKGIQCEIANWNFNKPWYGQPTGNWNGYITVLEKQIPSRFKELLCRKEKTTWKSMPWIWDYYKLENLFNMKGGLTFYSVIRDEFNGKKIAIKVGNDYMHSWDIDVHYDKEDVESDLKKSINSFIEKFPDYLVWNKIDGSYNKPELIKE